MRLRLLEAHTIPIGPGNDRLYPKGAILDPPPFGYVVTPLMEGLDDEARAAVYQAHIRVFGRYPYPYGLFPPSGTPLDDPPIPRPLEENQPVYHFTGSPDYT